ncbi:hypothetical protein [Actinomadura sp. B10D3]|uniref:hypothetical protein n=1 Tax=Actinomadura sp. B10D3 TaxID=3153557 RepID=UPI00325DB3A7
MRFSINIPNFGDFADPRTVARVAGFCRIVRRLNDHLDADADHVGVQVIGVEPGRTAMPQWRRLAEALAPERAAV